MDATTTLTGAWAPVYAERVAALEGFAVPDFDPTQLDPAQPDAALAGGDSPENNPFRALAEPFGPAEPTDALAEDRGVPGPHGPVPVRIYRPASGEPSGVGLVWLHGGAFVGGDLDMPEADLVARGLVTRARCVVVSVDYRLCQGGVHHPIPHDDCYAAYLWMREHAAELGVDPARIAVGGASAGGNLAASVALHGRDAGVPPWQALLAYPVAHPVLPEPSDELAACLALVPEALRFRPATTRLLNENLLGGPIESADAYAFASLADDLAGYPPTYMENCEFDDLRASGEAFARQLAAAGVDVEVVTAAGVPHGHLNAVGSPLTHASLDRFAARLSI